VSVTRAGFHSLQYEYCVEVEIIAYINSVFVSMSQELYIELEQSRWNTVDSTSS